MGQYVLRPEDSNLRVPQSKRRPFRLAGVGRVRYRERSSRTAPRAALVVSAA